MAALKHMRPRNQGTIVQVGSALSYRAIPLQSAYCGAKFAIRGFTDALRSELEHDRSRIRLTMVQLPAVNTPQFDWARSRMPRKLRPVPPIYQPEAIASEIVRAAFEAPRELWIGKSALKAIFGGMLLPLLGDRILASEGYSGQMTPELAPPDRRDNLFEPCSKRPGSPRAFRPVCPPRCDGVRSRSGSGWNCLRVDCGRCWFGRHRRFTAGMKGMPMTKLGRNVLLGNDLVFAYLGHGTWRLDGRHRSARLGAWLRIRGTDIRGRLAVVAAALYFWTSVSRVLLFWSAFILTRPLGATVGDLLDKPIASGGLALSRCYASAILVVFIIACIVLLPQSSGKHPGGETRRH
jgi:hypothetical protein